MVGGLLATVSLHAQWTENVDEALSRAADEGRSVLVLVTADQWCDPCLWLEANTLTDPRVVGRLRSEWIAVRVTDTDPSWNRWDVPRLPTLLFLSPSGEVLSQISGAVIAETLLQRMETLAWAPADEVSPVSAQTDPTETDRARTMRNVTFELQNGALWNSGDVLWYTRGIDVPSLLTEFDRDESFLYLRAVSNNAVYAITISSDVPPSLWQWDGGGRSWLEVGALKLQ